MSHEIDTRNKIKPNIKITEPPMFKVIYINDNFTTMDFVVRSLVDHFSYTSDTAESITTGIHEQGSATCLLYTSDAADE